MSAGSILLFRLNAGRGNKAKGADPDNSNKELSYKVYARASP